MLNALENALKNYGLTANQAKIYLACLEIGSGPVQKISQISSLPRTTCYQVLESLRPLGLISSFQKKKVKFFSAEDPHMVIKMAEEKTAQLAQFLPDLVSLYGTSNVRPNVRFYQGKQAVINILQEFLNEGKELLAFSPTSEHLMLDKYFDAYVQQRVKKRIPAKIIAQDSEYGRNIQRSGPQELREVRIIPISFDQHNLIFIWNKKVAMFALREDFTVFVMESVEVSQFYKTTFNYLWQTLPPAPKF